MTRQWYGLFYSAKYSYTVAMTLHAFYLLGHFIGLAIGLGSVLLVDVLWMRAQSNEKFSHSVRQIFPILSGAIWIGLVILIASGLLLMLERPSYYLHEAYFQLKLLVTVIILLNGLYLNIKIRPRLDSLLSSAEYTGPGRLAALASGAISIVSWFAALVLALFRSTELSFGALLILYLTMIVVAVGVGLAMEFIRPEKDRGKLKWVRRLLYRR
jgi:hypothetical protein